MDGSGACCGACAFAIEVAKAGGPKQNPNGHLAVTLDARGAPMGVSLRITSKFDGWAKHIPINKARVVLGRELPSDILLPDGRLSTRQCSFDLTRGEVIVEDMRSTCGTYVNGEPIGYGGRRALREGDIVLVGGAEIEVIVG